MSKTSKRHMCPALGREITPADCGENRVSRYACPAECPHNPFSPAHYSALLELEDAVDRKAMDWLKDTTKDLDALERGMRRALEEESGHAVHACVEWQLFFQRDQSGLTAADHWQQTGFPGLKNDERILIRAKMLTRVPLWEIRRVLDEQRTEAADLLSPDSKPLLIVDRALASVAVRFAAFLGWTYPLPHYWRMAGTAIVIPDWGPFEPIEIVSELVRHLGGPTAPAEIPRWLAEHFVRFDEALSATGQSRRRQMFAGMDVQFGKAVYELKAPFNECRIRLDAEPDVDHDPLADAERREGFAEARVWFAQDLGPILVLPEGGRPVLGQVLLGQAFWRVEAMGIERLAELRKRFEARLGNRVKFTGERRDDLTSHLASQKPDFDAALVPPRLLEHPMKVAMTSSRVEPLPPGKSFKDYEAELFRAQDRAFPDSSIPALDGKTPRQAARDPILRPKLVRLMKTRVRAQDEQNLRTGRTDDVNWLLRELGLDELLFDPPPPRARRNLVEEETDDSPWPMPDPPPSEPLTFEQARQRLQDALDYFETAAAALAELEASGSTLIEDAGELTADLLTDNEFSYLVTFLIQAWFALVPPGSPAPVLHYEDLERAFRTGLDQIRLGLAGGPEGSLQRMLSDCRQPELTQLIMDGLLDAAMRAPKKVRPSPAAQAVMVVLLKAVLNELDRALRG
jgi:hypothetical protein